MSNAIGPHRLPIDVRLALEAEIWDHYERISPQFYVHHDAKDDYVAPFKWAKEVAGSVGRNRMSFCIHLRGQVKAQAVGAVARRSFYHRPLILWASRRAHAQTCAGE